MGCLNEVDVTQMSFLTSGPVICSSQFYAEIPIKG